MIYFAQIDVLDGPIKIGFSSKPVRRFKEIKLPWRLKILGTVEGQMKHERWLHYELADDRMNGEWFVATPKVLQYMEKILLPEWTWPTSTAIPRLRAPRQRDPSVSFGSLVIPSGRQLKAIRKWHGLAQNYFAKEAKVSKATILSYENGKTLPSYSTLQAIGLCVRALGIEFDGDVLTLPE